MVNDALNLSSTKDSKIFADWHIKIGIGSEIQETEFNDDLKEIYVTFDSHLALLFRRPRLTPRLGV